MSGNSIALVLERVLMEAVADHAMAEALGVEFDDLTDTLEFLQEAGYVRQGDKGRIYVTQAGYDLVCGRAA